VIVVGNLTSGGSGKTPVVELVVRMLCEKGLQPGVVSRGYGRASHGTVIVADRDGVRADARAGGDEPVQIARKFPGVPVVVASRRYDAAKICAEKCGAHIIVSDDGFQHRWLHRDCDIVVVDGLSDLASQPLLPAGMRREPMRGLKRASLLVLSGTLGPDQAAARIQALRRWFSGPVVKLERSFEYIIQQGSEERLLVSRLGRLRCFCFNAVGKPERFAADLVRAGANIVGEKRYRDHHVYTPREIAQIVAQARDVKAEVFVTTEKDLARVMADRRAVEALTAAMPLWVPVLTVQAVPREPLDSAIAEVIAKMH
jgi:tetraacyldisaccharide 4'-kinase